MQQHLRQMVSTQRVQHLLQVGHVPGEALRLLRLVRSVATNLYVSEGMANGDVAGHRVLLRRSQLR